MIISLLRTLLSGILIFFFGIILIPPLLLCTLVPYKYRHNFVLYILLYVGYRALVYSLLLPVSIKGKNHILKEPMIIVANHQSFIDTPLLGLVTGWHSHIWIVLDYYAHTPLLGVLIRRLFVAVDRSTNASSGKALVKLLRLSKSTGGNIMIFPEGARFSDGNIHEFLPGFALLAKKTGYPVLPVLMPNNYRVLPVGGTLVCYASLQIIIGKAFIYDKESTEENFVKEVHEWFVTENSKVRLSS